MSSISTSLPQTNTAVATSTPKAPVVAQSNDTSLALTAVNISSEAAVVGTLAGADISGSGYGAASLLSFLQQTTPTTTLAGATGGSSDPTTTAPPSSSAAGSVADWSALLKQDPALAYTAATDSFNQAVLSTLDIVA
ncbi:MAG TPA: hypothetical protein VIE69_03080 [Methylophilaceae bacterium]